MNNKPTEKLQFPLLGIKQTDSLGDIAKMILLNPIIKEQYNPPTTPANARKYIRFVRFALLGESLIEYSLRKTEVGTLSDDIMSSLVDLYLFYARSIYNGLMQDFRNIYGKDLPMDYDEKFINKIKNGKYKIDKYPDLQKLIAEDRLNFLQLRNLRNAIKNAEVNSSIQRIEGKAFVTFTGEHRGEEINIQEKLDEFVFGISFSIWVLMTPSLHKIERKRKINN